MPSLVPTPPRLPRTALKADERDPALAAGRRILRSAALSADRWPEYRGGNSTEADRRAILDELRLSAAEATRDLTARLVAGDISRPAWHRQMRDLLVPRHYAAALAVAGDGASLGLDAATRRDVEAIVRRQLGFLQRFRDDLGFKRLDGTTEQRAELYGLAVWSTGQEVARGKANRDGFRFESNVLGAHDHCEECLAETDRGWVPIGDLSPIGGRICKTRCGCHLAFRRGDGAETKIAGRKRPAARQPEPAAEAPKAPAVAARSTKGKHAAELSPGVLPAFVLGDDGEFHEVKKVKGPPKPGKAEKSKPDLPPAGIKKTPARPARPLPSPSDGKGVGKAETLRKVFEDHPPGPGRDRAVVDWIDRHKTGDTIGVKTHGMSGPERMHSLRLEGNLKDDVSIGGITFHFPADADPADHPLARTINYLHGGFTRKELPSNLTRHTKNVYFSTQRDNKEDYFNRLYNIPDGVVKASAGDGDIVVYRGKHINPDTLAHEMGHNLARAKYGSTKPGRDSEFAGAASKDGEAPTPYGRNSIDEDFAESVMLNAVGDPSVLQRHSPGRYKVVKRLFEDDGYGG